MSTALLLVDAQVNMFDPAARLYDREGVLDRLRVLLAEARREGSLVVHVQNDGPAGEVDEPGTPGWHIHPALAPVSGELAVRKTTPDAFASTELERDLRRHGVTHLVVAGMQTDFCVGATCHGALARGFQLTLAGDAHSTFDGRIPAVDAIARLNRSLGAIAEVCPAASVSF